MVQGRRTSVGSRPADDEVRAGGAEVVCLAQRSQPLPGCGRQLQRQDVVRQIPLESRTLGRGWSLPSRRARGWFHDTHSQRQLGKAHPLVEAADCKHVCCIGLRFRTHISVSGMQALVLVAPHARAWSTTLKQVADVMIVERSRSPSAGSPDEMLPASHSLHCCELLHSQHISTVVQQQPCRVGSQTCCTLLTCVLLLQSQYMRLAVCTMTRRPCSYSTMKACIRCEGLVVHPHCNRMHSRQYDTRK